MAVTRVTHTTKGFDAINYALSGSPHVSDKYVSGRVLASSGVNCTVHGCRTQMNAVWKRYGINRPTRRHRRQVQRLIQSFDPHQLNYKKPEDVAEANAIGRKLAHKLYPNRQSIVVTQADNTRHILHNHIITNMLDYRTGKSMTGTETSWRYVQQASDRVISQDFGLNPEANKRMIETVNGRKPQAKVHQTDAEYHIKHRKSKYGNYSWVTDVRSRINTAKNKAVSWTSFISECRQHGVVCDPYRKHKGGIRRDKDGNPVFKKRISFSFTGDDGKNHRIRDRKLGADFGKPALTKAFATNRKPKYQHNSAIISDSLDLKPFLQKSASQQSSASPRPISHATDEQSYMVARARRDKSLAISASLSASASQSASMSASRSASVSASSASYSASVSQSMSASLSASISQLASSMASSTSASSASAEANRHDDAKTFDFIHAHSVDPVMKKLRPNARWAMVNQIPLLPKLASQDTLTTKVGQSSYKLDDVLYNVKPDDRQTKLNWFQSVINSWHSLRTRLHDKWTELKKATHHWLHRAKWWLHGGKPSHERHVANHTSSASVADAIKSTFKSGHAKFMSYGKSVASQSHQIRSSVSSAHHKIKTKLTHHHNDNKPSSSSGLHHSPSDDGPEL